MNTYATALNQQDMTKMLARAKGLDGGLGANVNGLNWNVNLSNTSGSQSYNAQSVLTSAGLT